jgi:hypothetical protein
MINKINIEVDTDKTPALTIGHPIEFTPTTPDEAKTVIINDISCIFEAFKTLVHLADQSGYGTKEAFIKTAVDDLNQMLIVDNVK